MPRHPLTNFEIQKYYQNEPRFNGLYLRDNLPKLKDETYVINLYEYSDIGTQRIVFYVSGVSLKEVKNNGVTYFDSFGVEHIPKKLRTFISNKNIKTNIFRTQAFDF